MRSYNLISIIIAFLACVPFYVTYEKREGSIRRMVLLAVMTAIQYFLWAGSMDTVSNAGLGIDRYVCRTAGNEPDPEKADSTCHIWCVCRYFLFIISGYLVGIQSGRYLELGKVSDRT